MAEYYSGDEKKDKIIALKIFVKIILIIAIIMAIALFLMTGKIDIKTFALGLLIFMLGVIPVVFIGYKHRIKNPNEAKRISKFGMPKWLAYVFVIGGFISLLINSLLIFVDSMKNDYLLSIIIGIVLASYGIKILKKYKQQNS